MSYKSYIKSGQGNVKGLIDVADATESLVTTSAKNLLDKGCSARLDNKAKFLESAAPAGRDLDKMLARGFTVSPAKMKKIQKRFYEHPGCPRPTRLMSETSVSGLSMAFTGSIDNSDTNSTDNSASLPAYRKVGSRATRAQRKARMHAKRQLSRLYAKSRAAAGVRAMTIVSHAAKQTKQNSAKKSVSLLAGPKASLGIWAASAALTLFVMLGVLGLLFFVDTTLRSRNNLDGLTGNERIVAAYLFDKGLDDVHVAAIMANISAESNFQTGAIESNAVGHGLCQWSYGRWDALSRYALSLDRLWTDISVQLDFFWMEYEAPWSGVYVINEGTSPLPGTHVRGSRDGFLAATDVAKATLEFCYGWERPGIPHEDRRLAAAEKYLAGFRTPSGDGSGQSLAGATATQKRVVEESYRTAWPGANLCGGWVLNVFEGAGLPVTRGDACDLYRWWCSSTDTTQLQAGMIIAVESNVGGGAMGITYGHVGLYIGDDTVRESVGSGVREVPLSQWIAMYSSTRYPAKWGWIQGRDLAKG